MIHLVKPLQEIFDGDDFKAIHGEIVITVTAGNVCTNFTQRINQVAIEYLQALQPKVTSALPVSAVSAAKYLSPVVTAPSTLKNLNNTDNTSSVSLPAPKTAAHRQIDWPSHPSFNTGHNKQKVTAMYGSHTLAFSRFFYVDKNLKHAFKDQPLYKNFKKSMQNGHFISDKGAGFKRGNVSYINCHGHRQQAAFKFNFANEDSRVFVRIADAETHPRQILYIADGFKAHTHKR